MVEEFSKIIEELNNSEVFKKFEKENKGYCLAHGFIQLKEDFTQKSIWQIGYYSKDKDNLAVFEVNPTKFVDFEDAFKKEGEIPELKNINAFLKTNDIIEKLKKHLKDKYSNQLPNSFILILQVINDVPLYNITTITSSFNMINTRFDAKSGEIISDKISSVLDLKKE